MAVLQNKITGATADQLRAELQRRRETSEFYIGPDDVQATIRISAFDEARARLDRREYSEALHELTLALGPDFSRLDDIAERLK